MSWPTLALGELTTKIGSGATPRGGSKAYKSEGTPLIRSMNVHDGVFRPDGLAFIDGKQAKALDNVILSGGDVLLNITGASVARCCRLPSAYAGGRVNQHVAIIRAKADLLRSDYLEHLLTSSDTKQKLLGIAGGGATREAITKAAIESFQIPLPPLEEQRRIARILDQADALRRLRTRALDTLNTLGQAIFHEMFGDPLKEQRNSPAWTVEALDKSIGYIDYRGKTPPKAENGVRLITAKNVKMGYINPEPMEFIVEGAFSDWMTRGFPKKGDVLFTTEAPLGNVAILDSNQTLAVGQRLLTMQPNHAKILSEYLAFYLRTPEFTKRMMENSSGSTVRGIKSKLLKKIEICYPPLAFQKRFAEALDAHSGNKSLYENAAKGSQALFASLQHRAFRGEL